MKKTGAESFPATRPLVDEPWIIIILSTDYLGVSDNLTSVSCLRDNELWTCSSYNNKILILCNLQGNLLKSVQTKSGNSSWDIAVTQSRDLVYTYDNARSINIVKNTQIQPLIRLRGWRPLNLCSSGVSDDLKQAKVIRYSGSKEKHTIQWNDKSQPIYSSSTNTKCLTENRNLDICVADFSACAVVVVDAAGKLRFRYTGPPSNTKMEHHCRQSGKDSDNRQLTTTASTSWTRTVTSSATLTIVVYSVQQDYVWT